MKKWTLQDVILLALVAIIFSAFYWVMGPIYNVIYGLLGVLGWQPIVNDLTLGGWMMAAPLAAVLLRRAGAGLLAEMLAAAGEMFLGGAYGLSTLLSGFVQGLGSELGFTLTGYRSYRLGLWLSTLTGTVLTFGWDLVKSGYDHYAFGFLLLLFCVRYLSLFFFCGLLVHWINRLLVRAHLLTNED
ncbi:ECF transporter S component [Leuconostocaceae bacterium ESL0958]|nr:ECF transporter S component [Leuconostocaceae bacterium ESL0958]